MPRKQKAGWLVPVSSSAPVAANPTASTLGTVPILPTPPYNATMQQPLAGGNLDLLSMTIMYLNTNPYMVGMFMLLLNLGGRFLSLELTKKQETFLQAAWLRPLLFFTVVFVATRNLVAAFWTTLLFFFIIWVAANEHSPFCLIPSWCESAK